MLELREEMKWYPSFTDEEVFWGVALPKKEEEESLQTLFTTDVPQNTPCAGASSGRESPKVFGMGESTTPIPASGGHWGDPPTNQDLEAESRIKSTLPDDTYKASGL